MILFFEQIPSCCLKKFIKQLQFLLIASTWMHLKEKLRRLKKESFHLADAWLAARWFGVRRLTWHIKGLKFQESSSLGETPEMRCWGRQRRGDELCMRNGRCQSENANILPPRSSNSSTERTASGVPKLETLVVRTRAHHRKFNTPLLIDGSHKQLRFLRRKSNSEEKHGRSKLSITICQGQNAKRFKSLSKFCTLSASFLGYIA